MRHTSLSQVSRSSRNLIYQRQQHRQQSCARWARCSNRRLYLLCRRESCCHSSKICLIPKWIVRDSRTSSMKQHIHRVQIVMREEIHNHWPGQEPEARSWLRKQIQMGNVALLDQAMRSRMVGTTSQRSRREAGYQKLDSNTMRSCGKFSQQGLRVRS